MDRIARIWHQNDVARRSDCLRDVGKAFLGPPRRDDLSLRVELHPEAARVVGRLSPAQSRDSFRGGIAVGARPPDCLLKLFDDVRRCWKVRITHAEVDDVGPLMARNSLRPVHRLEHVRWQAANTVKLIHRRLLGAGHRERWFRAFPEWPLLGLPSRTLSDPTRGFTAPS